MPQCFQLGTEEMNQQIKPIDFNLGFPIAAGTVLGLSIAFGVGLLSFKKEKINTKSSSLVSMPLALVEKAKEFDEIAALNTSEIPAKKLLNKPETPTQNWEPDLNSMVSEPAVLIYGSVGSGKSSKGGYLVTKHLQLNHHVEIVNPLNKYKQYEPLKVWGTANNFKEAEAGIERFSNEAKRRLEKRGVSTYDPFEDNHWFLLLEEVTNWESKMSQSIMGDFIEICTQYLRQANMSVAIISHGKTLTCLGGKSAGNGKKDTLMNQFLRLHCQAKHDPSIPGGKSCAGWAILEWNSGGSEKTKQVVISSKWQPPNSEYNYADFVNCSIISEQKKESEPEAEVITENKQNALPTHMQAILDFCKECFEKNKQPVKARDIQRSNRATIKEQNLTPHAIRIAFQLLAQKRYGTTQGEDEYLTFTPYVA